MALSKPHAIIFDWDNTLVNSWNKMHLVINETFKEMNLPLWDRETVKKNVKLSFADAGRDFFGDRVDEAKKIFYHNYNVKFEHVECNPLPDSLNLLWYLKDNNIYSAVVSNKNGDLLRREIEKLEWNKYFAVVIGSKDAEFDKPKPHPVYLALQNQFSPSEHIIWFIGDSTVDIECAVNSGCIPILYGDKEAAHDIDEKNFKFQHIPTHAELIALLEKL